MGSGDERESELALKRLDQVEDAGSSVAVELTGWLVTEKQLRALRERSGDRDPLCFPAGELAGEIVDLLPEPDELEESDRLSGAVPLFGHAYAREGNVLVCRQRREQVRPLEDVGDRLRLAPPGRFVERARLAAAPLDSAGGRFDEAPEDVQQGRFPGT